ncbi:MAG: hypothetical protein ACOC83_09360 [Gemmatimonadota bacterium]
MSTTRWSSPVHLGFLAGAALMVAADAASWFLGSPENAGSVRTWLVGGQLVVGVAICLWALHRGEAIQEARVRDGGDGGMAGDGDEP